jgi:hypothetical protein
MHPEARLDERERVALEAWMTEMSAAPPMGGARP